MVWISTWINYNTFWNVLNNISVSKLRSLSRRKVSDTFCIVIKMIHDVWCQSMILFCQKYSKYGQYSLISKACNGIHSKTQSTNIIKLINYTLYLCLNCYFTHDAHAMILAVSLMHYTDIEGNYFTKHSVLMFDHF